MTTAVAPQMVTVGLGEIHTSTTGSQVLMALGLGSCVGVAVYDARKQVGGMAHVVLPAPLDAAGAGSTKFANVAVPALIERVMALGADRSRLQCKLAGGAEVLAMGNVRHNFRIGERNLEAVLAALTLAGVKPSGIDCGGTTGRSFRLTVHDGSVRVKRLGKEWRDL